MISLAITPLNFRIDQEILAVFHKKSESPNELTKNRNIKISPASVKWFSWGLVGLATIATAWGISDALHQLATGRVTLSELFAGISFRLFPIIFATLAALVINRQPANLIGWLMAVPSLGGILTFISETYFQGIVAPPVAPSSFFLVMIWISSTSWITFIFPIILIPLFFPDGHPPSPRWNWVKYYASVMLLFLFGVATVSKEISPSDGMWTVTNPIGFLSNDFIDRWLGLPWSIALVLLVSTCIAALIVRYRRGTSVEKAQIKWVVYASLFFGIIYLALLPVSFQGNNSFLNSLFSILLGLSLLVVPLGISIAILRYRLWDIDFVINRSLVYGSLTVLLAAVFGGSLYLVSVFVQGQSFILAFGVTALLAGGLFNPTRRRIQRFVDQRFYHINIDYQKTPLDIPSRSATQVLRGTQFGAYQNLELIGRGGMAEVYRSTHPTLHKPVAIKILPEHLAMEEDFRKRFTREAQIVSKLEHPNIVRLFDSGENNGKHYMVMEYLTGKDLSEFIRANGKLTLSQALPLIKQIASALDYAHTQGLVHRDIKPSNVLLDTTTNGTRAILTDFGIAKIIQSHTAMTKTGGMLGTFDYMAPEQIQESTNVDGRADIYALGVMVYQMLTGDVPFKHNNPGALLIAHLTQPPPDVCKQLPNLPEKVCDAIQRAMAKKPDERFTTASEFAKALVS